MTSFCALGIFKMSPKELLNISEWRRTHAVAVSSSSEGSGKSLCGVFSFKESFLNVQSPTHK